MPELRILVIDDEAGMRSAIDRALRGFSIIDQATGTLWQAVVDQADSAERGLELARSAPPDLILLDHLLPGMDGLAFLEQLGDADLLVVMITAYASFQTAVTATKRGAYDFLPKPFTPEELRTVLRKASAHLFLQRKARRLEDEKRRVRFEFVRVLGHELKSPIAAVEGYLAIIANRTLGQDLTAYDTMIERSMLRLAQMRKLVVDLLDMTRLESGEKRRELTTVDLREVVLSALDAVTAEARNRSLGLHLEGPERLLLQADRSELEMLVNNLVTNAVKYNRDGGQVTVRLAMHDDGIRLEVADTGIGMSQDEVKRLFGEFVRIRSAQTRHILGSGLGLSIVRRIVSLYQGQINVASQPGQGTTFTVDLPLKATVSA